MAQLAWKEIYNVGVKELDIQHKELLDLVNRICCLDPNFVSKKEVFAALNALVTYAQNHFDTEERYLQTHGYPHLPQQHREHVAFTDDVFKFAQKLESDDPKIYRKVADFTKNWYLSHILGTDQEYKAFFFAKGVT